MYRLATAVMWIEYEILGLPEDALLAFPHQSRGKLLLADVLEGGNFGHYGARQKYKKSGKKFSKWMMSLLRLLRFSRIFPSMTFFSIIYRTITVLRLSVKRVVSRL